MFFKMFIDFVKIFRQHTTSQYDDNLDFCVHFWVKYFFLIKEKFRKTEN